MSKVVAVVTIDGRRWVADVGLGDGPQRPFELSEGNFEQNGRKFVAAPSSYHSSSQRFAHVKLLRTLPALQRCDALVLLLCTSIL